jgi:AcrR family transcriptional regulator
MSLRERKKQETRQLLLSVAEDLFNEKAFDEVTVADIVTRANISRKTFFNYFQSKAGLLEELVLNWMVDGSLWAETSDFDGSAESALIPPNVEESYRWIVSHRRILKMLAQHTEMFDMRYKVSGDSGRLKLFFSRIRAPRLERVKRAQDAGVIRSDISVDYICDMYDLLRIEAVMHWINVPDEDATRENFRQRFDTSIEILLRGISLEAS